MYLQVSECHKSSPPPKLITVHEYQAHVQIHFLSINNQLLLQKICCMHQSEGREGLWNGQQCMPNISRDQQEEQTVAPAENHQREPAASQGVGLWHHLPLVRRGLEQTIPDTQTRRTTARKPRGCILVSWWSAPSLRCDRDPLELSSAQRSGPNRRLVQGLPGCRSHWEFCCSRRQEGLEGTRRLLPASHR